MYSKHRISFLLTLLMLITFLSGCSFTFHSDNATNSSSLSYIPYEKTAASTQDILDILMDTMVVNEPSCNIFITDKNLIDADLWLASLPGIEEIHCGYKKINNGYNIQISLQYWDNYAIVHAYKTNDTSYLSDRQLELFNKYCDVLNQYTSAKQNDYQNELAIHDYLVSNLSYVTQENTRYNAYEALIHGEAVCSGYTECFKTFMDLLGIENNTISGESDNERHIWNEVKIEDEWYQVDVTWDDPINGTSQYIDHSYFNITDSDMALDHTWDNGQADFHYANGTKYSYPNIMGLIDIRSQDELNQFISNCINKRATYLEFQSNQTLDIKNAMSFTNITLAYSYKIVERTEYSIYTVTFDYDT